MINAITDILPWHVFVYDKPIDGLGFVLALDLRLFCAVMLFVLVNWVGMWLWRKTRDIEVYRDGFEDGLNTLLETEGKPKLGKGSTYFVVHDCTGCRHNYERGKKVASAISMAAVFAFISLSATAATNLVSNTATITNRVHGIVTYTMSNGVARVQDPSGKLVGTAEERALKIAAEGQADIASAAADAAGTAMEEWREFTATTDVKVVYIDAGFSQDLPALAPNFCGWVAGSFYDKAKGEDHYYIWFNREIDYPPSMAARIVSESVTNWADAAWIDFDVTHTVQGVPCRELVVPRRNANCVLKTGTIITIGGRDGFDADIHKVNIEVGGTASATTSAQLPLFHTVTYQGTNRVVRAYANGFVNVENGFVKEPTNE